MQNNKPYIEEEYVFCVGNREYDEEYERPIKESKAVYYPLSKLRSYGIKRVVSDFLMRAEEYDLEGYFIHLDVDVLNDKIMPAVDCRQEDGLSYRELKEILIPLVKDKRCVGLEIAILDPDLDPLGIYTKEFIENVRDIIEASL
ncbi:MULTISPECIES: arginase family protein [Myroides]|uniref:arginase family protein n=1 Tax=Myroides TaxID=76831 RepID=UPI002934AE20|nr:arginase family protein [Myroides odoratimimus]